MNAPSMAGGYNVELAVPDFRAYLEHHAGLSRATRERRCARLNVAYGNDPLERLDVFPADSKGGPVVLYVHGGGWRASSKDDRSFPADVFCPLGVHWTSIDYPLAPAASLDAMVNSVHAALQWVRDHADEFGADRKRVFLAGNSAGAHLAAMAMVRSPHWIQGATLLSGCFDLTELLRVGACPWLRLDTEVAARNSPTLRVPQQGPPLLCGWGTDETPAFHLQSITFAAAWRSAGHSTETLLLEGNHFSILNQLADPKSPLVERMLAQMQSAA